MRQKESLSDRLAKRRAKRKAQKTKQSQKPEELAGGASTAELVALQDQYSEITDKISKLYSESVASYMDESLDKNAQLQFLIKELQKLSVAGGQGAGGKLPPVRATRAQDTKKDKAGEGKKVSAAQERLRERLKANPELAAKYRAKAAKLKAAKMAKDKKDKREE